MIIDIAKAVRIEDEIARRGMKLVGRDERVGACPLCGGKDRFAINIKKQIWNCRGCAKGGDVIALVQHIDNCDFKAAVVTLGGDERRPIRPAPKASPSAQRNDVAAANTARALRLWDDASPIDGTLAEEYLRRRGLEPPAGDEALRFYGGCPFGDTSYPALIALFRCVNTDEAKAIHRIALGPGGILIGKRMLGRVGGCAVKIDDDVEQGLVIGEGVETCLAARKIGLKPCWALGSAGAIRSFPLLGGIDCLTILVDNDEADRGGRRAGPDAAAECSERWTQAGREVRRIMPRRTGYDMADICGGVAS
jgi:hypothetical protein